MTKTLLKLTTALTVMVTAPAFTQDNPVETRQYRAHAEFLASDLLEGRESGTRGCDIAADGLAHADEKGRQGQQLFRYLPVLKVLIY